MTDIVDINNNSISCIDDAGSISSKLSEKSKAESKASIKSAKQAAQAALIADEVALKTKNTPGSQFLAAGKYGCRPIPPKSEETAVIASKLHRDIVNVVRDNKSFDIYGSYSSTAPDIKPIFSSSVYVPPAPKYNKIVNDPLIDFCKSVTTKNTPKKKTKSNNVTSFNSSSIKINDIETKILPNTSGTFLKNSNNNFITLLENEENFRNNEAIDGDKSTVNLSLIDNNINEVSYIDNESYNDQEENNELYDDFNNNNNNNHPLNKNSLTYSYSDGSVATHLSEKSKQTPVTVPSGCSFTQLIEKEASKKIKVKHIVPKEKFSPLYWRVWNSEFSLLQNLSKSLAAKEVSSKKNYGDSDDFENKTNEIKAISQLDSAYVRLSPRRPQTWEDDESDELDNNLDGKSSLFNDLNSQFNSQSLISNKSTNAGWYPPKYTRKIKQPHNRFKPCALREKIPPLPKTTPIPQLKPGDNNSVQQFFDQRFNQRKKKKGKVEIVVEKTDDFTFGDSLKDSTLSLKNPDAIEEVDEHDIYEDDSEEEEEEEEEEEDVEIENEEDNTNNETIFKAQEEEFNSTIEDTVMNGFTNNSLDFNTFNNSINTNDFCIVINPNNLSLSKSLSKESKVNKKLKKFTLKPTKSIKQYDYKVPDNRIIRTEHIVKGAHSLTKTGLGSLDCTVMTANASFGFGCSRQEHVLYGMCLDRLCCKRALWEQTAIVTNDENRLFGMKLNKKMKPTTSFALSTIDAPKKPLSALHLAVHKCDKESIHNLKDIGLKCNDIITINDLQQTVLHVAVERRSLEIIDCLIEVYGNKLNLNCQDKNGDTPLHIASRDGNLDIVTMLCDAGCDAGTIKNNKGKKPYDIAKSHEVFKILRVSADLQGLMKDLDELELQKNEKILESQHAQSEIRSNSKLLSTKELSLISSSINNSIVLSSTLQPNFANISSIIEDDSENMKSVITITDKALMSTQRRIQDTNSNSKFFDNERLIQKIKNRQWSRVSVTKSVLDDKRFHSYIIGYPKDKPGEENKH